MGNPEGLAHAFAEKQPALARFERSYQYSAQIFEFVRSKEVAASYALPLPYLLAYSVGGMHSMLVKWVENGTEIPSCELAAMLKAGFASNNI